MISDTTRSVIELAKVVYRVHKVEWEKSHPGKFVAIEPVSGEWFIADSFDAAVRAARSGHPDRVSHTIRIGHDAALFIGRMES
jgi:hypothetical protein